MSRVLSAVVAVAALVFSAACSGGSESAPSTSAPSAAAAAGLSCQMFADVEASVANEQQFFSEMAALADRTGATVEIPADGDPDEVPVDSDGDVAAAFRRLGAAVSKFNAEYPAAKDETGEAFAALSPAEQEAYSAALEEMTAELSDDFVLTWAWIGQVEAELGCRD